MSLDLIDTNDVRLVGRLSAPPEPTTMPSGDLAVKFRIVVRRPPASASTATRRRRTVDAIECISYRRRDIKAAASWSPGDFLDVRGSLRRRFWRGGAGLQSASDVEVVTVRRVSRAPIGATNRPGRAKGLPVQVSSVG